MAPGTNNNISTKTIFSINGLLDALRRFNAKERFYLVGYFLGNPDFKPGMACLDKLEHDLGIPKGIFAKAVEAGDFFCAMDYHLDWLNGALERAFLSSAGDSRNGKSRIKGTQEDIDMLLAFDTPSQSKRYHIVLVEAKGVTSVSNKQLISKLNRLDAILLDNNEQPRFGNLAVHFILATPCGQHPRLKWQSKFWEKPELLELNIPLNDLLKITRYDDRGPTRKEDWSEWKVEKRKK